MDTGKAYCDSDGNDCSIWQMIQREPEWAASMVQSGEATTVELQQQKEKMQAFFEGAEFQHIEKMMTGTVGDFRAIGEIFSKKLKEVLREATA